MIHSGLVSVTFRQLSPEKIINLVETAGLRAIEWGGDVHVPHGDLDRARQVRQWCQDAGIEISSYGSYYRVVPEEPCPFGQVLETAQELGAPLIRVWAGKLASDSVSDEYRLRIVDKTRRIADQAAQQGISLAFEYHAGTLTDQGDSAVRLMKEIDHLNVGCYWQPRPDKSIQENWQLLDSIFPWLFYLHVFHWRVGAGENKYVRAALGEGEADWRTYLDRAGQETCDRFALLEFTRDDSPQSFLEDARVLKSWLKSG